MRNSRGFTLVELVVVIVILGILAAVALPRFTNLQRDARISKLQAGRGAVQAAAAMVYGTAQARTGQGNQACPVGGNANVDAGGAGMGAVCSQQGPIDIVNFYPAANAAGIVAAAGLGGTAAELVANGYATAGGGGAAGATITISVTGSANCQFTYQAPAVAGGAPTIGTLPNPIPAAFCN